MKNENLKKDPKFEQMYSLDKENTAALLQSTNRKIDLFKGTIYRPALEEIALTRTGNAAQARKLINSLRLKSANAHAFAIGIIDGWLGQKQKGAEYLQLAHRLYDYNLISIKVNKIV